MLDEDITKYTSLTGKVQNITKLEINASNGKRYHELEVVAGGTTTVSNFTILSKPVVYIMDKNATEWSVVNISKYYVALPAGFEGYVYLPRDSYLYNKSKDLNTYKYFYRMWKNFY